MVTWRDLGLEKGGLGNEFTPARIVCPFCGSSGHFNNVYRGETQDANGNIDLTSDIWQCIACANFLFITWRTEEGSFHYRVFPYEKQKKEAHESWPTVISDAYLKAVNALLTEDWDMAFMMARHAIGEATKSFNAEGESLVEEIADLKSRQLIPATMLEWAEKISQLSADVQVEKMDYATKARELLRFTRYFLDLLFTLPHDIDFYQNR